MTREEFKNKWGSAGQWPNSDREAEEMARDIDSLRESDKE